MSVSTRLQPTSRQGGFTLMELLVAMTLLGILMATLFGGLRLGTRVWEASDRSVEHTHQTGIIRGFLQGRFEEMLPMTMPQSDGRRELLFQGERTDVRFASSMPISVGSEQFLIELSLKRREGVDQVSDVVLRWRPLEALADVNGAGADERVLIEDVAGIAFGYFGRKGKQPAGGWSTDWRDQETLPTMIRIDLRFHGGDQRQWSPLIVSPMIDEWYDTVY